MAPGKRPFQVGPLGPQRPGLGPATAFLTPQGAVLPFGLQFMIPFRAFLEARLPTGAPTIPDEVLLKMHDELMKELERRGVKC